MVKNLPCKHEDWNLIPSSHVKSWVWWYATVTPELEEGVRTAECLELTSSPNLAPGSGREPVSKIQMENNWRRYPTLTAVFHTYTHKDTCTHTTAYTYMHEHEHAYITPNTNNNNNKRLETLGYATT